MIRAAMWVDSFRSASYVPLVEATSRPRTSAAMVATVAMATRTESLASGLR